MVEDTQLADLEKGAFRGGYYIGPYYLGTLFGFYLKEPHVYYAYSDVVNGRVVRSVCIAQYIVAIQSRYRLKRQSKALTR